MSEEILERDGLQVEFFALKIGDIIQKITH